MSAPPDEPTELDSADLVEEVEEPPDHKTVKRDPKGKTARAGAAVPAPPRGPSFPPPSARPPDLAARPLATSARPSAASARPLAASGLPGQPDAAAPARVRAPATAA